MKIRWTEQSLRLRITPTELSALEDEQTVTEQIVFPGGLRWQVRLHAAAETRLASDAQEASVSLSAADRTRLAEPDAEGVYFHADGLRFFVEKDFPCAHPGAAEAQERPTETFAAPMDFERRKQEAEYGA